MIFGRTVTAYTKCSMSNKLTYTGPVDESGRVEIPKRARKEIAQAFAGRRVVVTIERARKTRSTPQNAYYWGVVVPYIVRAFIEAGNGLTEGNKDDHELMHQFLKDRFLKNGVTISDQDGVAYELSSSTTRATTFEFMEYLDKIIHFAADSLNTVIPPPNTQTELW